MLLALSVSSGTGAVAERFMDEDGSVAIAMDDNAAGEDGSEKCLRVEEPVDGTLVRRKQRLDSELSEFGDVGSLGWSVKLEFEEAHGLGVG